MDISYYDYPWKHIIVDNLLDQESFTGLINYIESVYDFTKATKGYKELHNKDSNSYISNLLCPKILELKDLLFDKLNYANKILPLEYYPVIELVICPPNYKYGRIHQDTDYKLMTTVLYVYPEISDGTEIYSREDRDSYFGSVEWKQNRALCFVGQSNPEYQQSWHDYQNSKSYPRVTMNLNLSKTIHGKSY